MRRKVFSFKNVLFFRVSCVSSERLIGGDCWGKYKAERETNEGKEFNRSALAEAQ